MTTIAPAHEQQAEHFAAAVREHLADLPEAELDELLEGLPADLSERLADGDELGDPVQYADELRQAAGLPPQGEAVARPKRTLRESLRATRIHLAERSRSFWAATPARRSIRDFFVALRPVWWVLRGLVLAQVLLVFVGRGIGMDLDPLSLTVMLVLVVLSVQWGRGTWILNRPARTVRTIAQVVAVVLLLPVLSIVWNQLSTPTYIEAEPGMPQGLTANGAQIDNIFAFDCSGKPLDGVQLFDQNGQPITTLSGEPGMETSMMGGEPMWGFDEERQQSIVYGRNGLAGYSGMWNVFPLQESRIGSEQDPSDVKTKDAKWPIEHTLPTSPECAASEPTGQAEQATPIEPSRP